MTMGYVVFHMQKTRGTDSGTSAHIERKVKPSNADEERTHLNRRLIEYPDGVHTRTQAIQHRLETAGLTRKVGKTKCGQSASCSRAVPTICSVSFVQDVWTNGAPIT